MHFRKASADNNTIWWIIGGAVLLSLLGLFFLMKGGGGKEGAFAQCDLEPLPGYVYGIGDAIASSESEARAKAKEIALDDLVGKLIVTVQSEKELKKYVVAVENEEGVKKAGAESLKVKVNLKSVLQVSNFQMKEWILERGARYHIKVMVYMPQIYAQNLVLAYSYSKAIEELAMNKQYFTALKFAQKLKELSLMLQPVPSSIAESSKYISEAEEGVKKAKSIIAKLDTLDTSTPEGYMKYLVYLNELSSTAADVPNFEQYVEKVKNSKAVTFNLEGPRYVVRGQKVILKLKASPVVEGSYKIKLNSSGGDFPKETYLEDGEALIEGYIEGDSARVEANLSNIVIIDWKPDAVYSPNLKNVVKALLSTVNKPYEKVIFLPRNWRSCDVDAASYAQKVAVDFGWSVLDVEKAAEKFGKLFPTVENLDMQNVAALYIEVDSSEAALYGIKRSQIEVKNWMPSGCKGEKEILFAKAAIMTGNFDGVKNYPDGFIKAVAFMLDGKYEKALSEISLKDDKKSILLKAYINYQMGNYKDAVGLAKKVAEDYPEVAYWIMANSFAKIDDAMYLLNEMRDLYKATKKVKDCHPGYYAAAVLLEKFGNYKEAKDWILKALDIKPNNPEYLYEYAEILHKLGKDDKAKGILTDLLNRDLTMSLKEKVEELLSKIK